MHLGSVALCLCHLRSPALQVLAEDEAPGELWWLLISYLLSLISAWGCGVAPSSSQPCHEPHPLPVPGGGGGAVVGHPQGWGRVPGCRRCPFGGADPPSAGFAFLCQWEM